MIKELLPAIAMRDQLNRQFARLATTSYMKWWQGGFNTLEIKTDDSSWSKLQLVYTDGVEVYSYFNFSWERPENLIDSVSCINFCPKNKALFATALYKALKYVVDELNTPKIAWRVTVGNPIEKTYDRFCKKHGGRIVGIQRNHVLVNNKYYDSKLYEWINHKWVCDDCGHVERKKPVMCMRCGAEMIYKNPFNFGE